VCQFYFLYALKLAILNLWLFKEINVSYFQALFNTITNLLYW
jgi:hypothetical protein